MIQNNENNYYVCVDKNCSGKIKSICSLTNPRCEKCGRKMKQAKRREKMILLLLNKKRRFFYHV